MQDRHVIQLNIVEGTKAIPAGARAYLVLPNPGNGHDRIFIRARSRSGRWITIWQPMTNLHNFRVKTLPPEHPRYDDNLWDWEVEEWADKLNAAAEHYAIENRRHDQSPAS